MKGISKYRLRTLLIGYKPITIKQLLIGYKPISKLDIKYLSCLFPIGLREEGVPNYQLLLTS